MNETSIATLKEQTCQPCEGGVPALSPKKAERLLLDLEDWKLVDKGRTICRHWEVKNFMAGMQFLDRVADLAEQEGHHPDIHLTGYRNVTIELTTHAVGGLSENDFILAAKIDDLPVEVRENS